jgi:hypothetical protein
MAEAGRPTILNEELFKKIKQSILDGNDLRETAKVCEINEGTLYVWHSDNYLNIADKIEGWKRDRKLMLADKNIDGILQLPIDDKDFVKTVSDMSKFVKEALDKTHYSKRSEITGKDGEQLVQPVLVKFISDEKRIEDNGVTSGVQEIV